GDDSRWCAVTEFLGQVPLLQCLPGSSIRRIAEAVQVKHYEPGDYVAREGEPVDGLCIILDGQAEVSAPANTEEANRPDYVLNKYDYFGYGTNSSVHQVNVIAVTKLSCFVLPSQYGHLLQTKTIWNAEETPESHSLMEQILHLEKLEVDIFRGFTLPEAPTFNQVFGGQLIAQACFNHSLSCCHLYLPAACI
uniref:Cyclic nucleotide-binding domain-containing protein n=1 Tax=Aegilops tauschii subsp. strangulata TaxID=200361 RepID=A0A453CNU1_AEGTS